MARQNGLRSFDRETLYLSKQGLPFENQTTDDTKQEPYKPWQQRMPQVRDQ